MYLSVPYWCISFPYLLYILWKYKYHLIHIHHESHDCKVLIAFNKSWCFQHTILMKGLGAYDATDSVTKICSLSYISAMLLRLSQVVIYRKNIFIIPIPNPNHVDFKLFNFLLRNTLGLYRWKFSESSKHLRNIFFSNY